MGETRQKGCYVITIDLGSFYNRIKNKAEILDYLKNEILQDFRNEFPDIELSENMPLADMIQRIYTKTGIKFVIIIDEYDTFIRERQSEILLED